MRKLFLIICTLGMSCSLLAANGSEPDKVMSQNMKLKITVGDQVMTATLYDNPTSKDFVSLLPLTLTLNDYASTEKISDLPRKLSTKDAPSGSDPEVGDIAYYAPWGNLAVYYKDFRYSNSLIKIAKIDGDMKVFSGSGSVTIKIEIAK